MFSEHIFVKSGSIYVKPKPKSSTDNSTHIVEYLSPAEKGKCLVFVSGKRVACRSGRLAVHLLVLEQILCSVGSKVSFAPSCMQ